MTEIIKCDGPSCKEETIRENWKDHLDWAQVRIELFVSGRPDGLEETTANAATRIVELNFHSDECWQEWRRHGDPIDWPNWELKPIRIQTQRSRGSLAPLKDRAPGRQLLDRNRESTLSPGEFDKGKVVNPETF